MVNSPLAEVQLEGARAVFMLGADDDPATVENIDVGVVADDGSRWTATLLTLDAIGEILDRGRRSGECLGGRYFHCPDLLIAKQGDCRA